jgi:hypothetical protein
MERWGGEGGEQQACESEDGPTRRAKRCREDRGWEGRGRARGGVGREAVGSSIPGNKILLPPVADGLCLATCDGGDEGMW